jgi:pimeloyl-ACP methyl ester carboxylesterase
MKGEGRIATIRVNGVALYCETTGTGDFLILTHGSWTDGTGWDPVVAGLAELYQVVVWDRRGHSRSQAGDGPGSRAEDAADLTGLIEHVSGEPVHVAGNSYGAIVTLTLLTARPDPETRLAGWLPVRSQMVKPFQTGGEQRKRGRCLHHRPQVCPLRRGGRPEDSLIGFHVITKLRQSTRTGQRRHTLSHLGQEAFTRTREPPRLVLAPARPTSRRLRGGYLVTSGFGFAT